MYIKAGIIFRGLFSVHPGEYLVPLVIFCLWVYMGFDGIVKAVDEIAGIGMVYPFRQTSGLISGGLLARVG